MKKNLNIEAEGGELILQNEFGDIAIIPSKDADKIRDLLDSNCNGCIDSFIRELPILSNYAKDGTILPNLMPNSWGRTEKNDVSQYEPIEVKPKQPIDNSKFNAKFDKPIDNTTLNKDETYVDKKLDVPTVKKEIKTDATNKTIQEQKERELAINEYNTNVEAQPTLKNDIRTEKEKEINQNYSDEVTTKWDKGVDRLVSNLTPSGIINYTGHPLEFVGDVISAIKPDATILKDISTSKDRMVAHSAIQDNPILSFGTKLEATLNEARDLGINSLINAGTLEFNSLRPIGNLTPRLAELAKMGSISNNVADVLQLTKMLNEDDFGKLLEGDEELIKNTLVNVLSLGTNLANANVSVLRDNIRSWNTLSTLDKFKTVGAANDLYQTINQQKQRED